MKRNTDETGSTATMSRPQDARRADPSSGAGTDKNEMMKQVEAAGRPGPGHQALEQFVGNWKAEVKCWAEPGGAPQASEATAKGSWTMNGRFLQEDFHGEMMGKPFNGRTLLGYDNVKQRFNSVWISDMQTSMFVTEGQGESGNTVIKLEGTASCPASGRSDMRMKVVLRVLNPDKHTFEMFDLSQGEERKTMEITYTRP